MSNVGYAVLPDVPKENYAVKRYNTWDGTLSEDGPVQREENGDLHVPVGKFSLDGDHGGETWDGADVLLIIE